MECKYRIDILTLFPEATAALMNESIIGRAQKKGHIQFKCHQIRDFTTNKQNQVDDYPYGGGRGCVMQAQPLHACWQQAKSEGEGRLRTIFMSPCGKPFDQEDAKRLARDYDRLILVCGHYEGIDQRFIDECCDEEISIGDFVLTGGEIPAMAVADAVFRMIPGVLADSVCFEDESHWNGLLEYPQYTRPEVWEGRPVPEILRSGHHANIERWRKKQSLIRTMLRRPDMFDKLQFNTKQEKKLLAEMWEDYRMDLEKRLTEYAQLILRCGVNLQPGQKLMISCPVERADFARIVAHEAYALGCGEVMMNWTDDTISRETYLGADSSVFDSVHKWVVDMRNYVADNKCAWLAITGENPEALAGVDTDRIRRYQKASGAALADFYTKEMSNQFTWCVAAAATKAWAEKVFPKYKGERAVSALWEAILATARVKGKGNAVQAWNDHCRNIQTRVEKLNMLGLKSLHYKNALGTDLTVQLPQGHLWAGGRERCADGYEFCANIPTEEIFTLPHKYGVDGTVVSSLPLVINGGIVKNFTMVIEGGKITKVKAEEGQQLLEAALDTDEGARYLGEVALVPWNSPIRQSGILFYNTLFDENASCHFAFGAAYSSCLVGAEEMSKEELDSHGVNDSLTHIDFMVGTADLSIIGTTQSGEEIAIFTDGQFAI